LKSRSFTIIDLFDNRTINKYMDHELLMIIFKKYTKTFIPKYLQKWIKFGVQNDDKIVPLKDSALIRTVSEFIDGSVFLTYGQIVIWIYYDKSQPLDKLILNVRLSDKIVNFKSEPEQRRQFEYLELKSLIFESDENPTDKHWNKGVALKFEDTIVLSWLKSSVIV